MKELPKNIYQINRSDTTQTIVLGYVKSDPPVDPLYFYNLWHMWTTHCLEQVKTNGTIVNWNQKLNDGFLPFIIELSQQDGKFFRLSKVEELPKVGTFETVDLFVKPQQMYYVIVPIKGYKIYAASGSDKDDAVRDTILKNAVQLGEVGVYYSEEPHKWRATFDRPEALAGN